MAKFSINQTYTSTFNAATKEAAKKSPFSLIKFADIEANVENFYSIEDIESLKHSIKTTGLQEPPVVLPKNDKGKYVLISGERRWTAISQLIEEGETGFEDIYVKILSPDELDIPLSYEDKVKYLIVTANLHRNSTNEDILTEMKTLRAIYEKLKENGEPVPCNLRPFIAESLGMSETQVQRYTSIERHLKHAFFELFCKDALPVSVAENISKLSPIMQDAFYEQVKDKKTITQKMLDDFVAEKTAKPAKVTSPYPVNKRKLGAAKKAVKAVSKYLGEPIVIENEVKRAEIEALLDKLTTDLAEFQKAVSDE